MTQNTSFEEFSGISKSGRHCRGPQGGISRFEIM
jgi:hypothetical protein